MKLRQNKLYEWWKLYEKEGNVEIKASYINIAKHIRKYG